jgi:hypothetical protein
VVWASYLTSKTVFATAPSSEDWGWNENCALGFTVPSQISQ